MARDGARPGDAPRRLSSSASLPASRGRPPAFTRPRGEI